MKSEPAGLRKPPGAGSRELSARAKSDAASAEAELNELFRLGDVPVGLDGPTDGVLVMTTMQARADAALRALTAVWMPWQGKRFNAAAAIGDNRLTKSTGVVGKFLWPLYSMRDTDCGKLAFDFNTLRRAGKDDPDIQVMVIDYANVQKTRNLSSGASATNLSRSFRVSTSARYCSIPGEKYTKIGYFAPETSLVDSSARPSSCPARNVKIRKPVRRQWYEQPSLILQLKELGQLRNDLREHNLYEHPDIRPTEDLGRRPTRRSGLVPRGHLQRPGRALDGREGHRLRP